MPKSHSIAHSHPIQGSKQKTALRLHFGLLSGLIAYLFGAASAGAAEFSYPPDLPPQAAAVAAIRNAPQAKAAEAMVAAGSEERQRLEAGSYEWTTRLNSQQRNVIRPDNQRYHEWQGGIERPIRLPGKASLDSEIGAQGEALAKVAHGDALHETSRSLLQTWFTWLRQSEVARQWQRQVDSLAKQQQATTRRVQLGDAPKLELMQAEAATAQALAALEQARLRQSVAREDLAARFPSLPLPPADGNAPATAEPQPLEAGDWRPRLFEHNHELGLARAESERARLLASRADAERLPDPTLGVHMGSDLGGNERYAGVTLSIPLPGSARAATARRDAALATASASKEAAVRAKVGAEVASLLTSAGAAYESWRRAEEAAQRIEQATALMARAYRLGEAGISDLLTAQRQANEARLTATQARLDALEARYRVYVDAHLLWPADNDEDEK